MSPIAADGVADAPWSYGRCFGGTTRRDSPIPIPPTRLRPGEAQALADLMPLLACGEESASLAFDHLAGRREGEVAEILRRIAREESGHDVMLAGIKAGLPAARNLASAQAIARRFYRRLQERDPARHLARITALDSAVCVIIAALTRAGRGVSHDPAIHARLCRIRSEEVGHVRAGLHFGAPAGCARATIYQDTRTALIALLTPFADRFEALAVDPDALFRALGILPGALRR